MTIEQVAEEMGDAPRWFQLYPGKSNEIMASMLHRVEESGYEAIVVTLDTAMLGFRERDPKKRSRCRNLSVEAHGSGAPDVWSVEMVVLVACRANKEPSEERGTDA